MRKHRWMNDDTDELMLAILQLKSLAEARAFFGDLLTEKEIHETANRWRVAKMLDFGIGYRKIERITGMSSATVSRIRKKMEEGLGGYRLMMGKLRQK